MLGSSSNLQALVSHSESKIVQIVVTLLQTILSTEIRSVRGLHIDTLNPHFYIETVTDRCYIKKMQLKIYIYWNNNSERLNLSVTLPVKMLLASFFHSRFKNEVPTTLTNVCALVASAIRRAPV